MLTADQCFDNYFGLLEKCQNGTITADKFMEEMEQASNALKAIVLTTKAKQNISNRHYDKDRIYYKQFPASELPTSLLYLSKFTFSEVVHHLNMQDQDLKLRFYTEEINEAGSFDSGYGKKAGFYDRNVKNYVNVKVGMNISETIRTILHETYHAYQHKKLGTISGLDPDTEREALNFEKECYYKLLPSLALRDRLLNSWVLQERGY